MTTTSPSTSPNRRQGSNEALVVVVGSINLDMVVPVPHHPRPGETVLGRDHWSNPGGKGANQAVAAARLGRRVAMVGRVGEDDAGRQLRAALAAEGVDVSHVTVTNDAPTGVAMISVDPEGENAIIVSPGANARLSAGDVDAAGRLLDEADAVLLQLEIPLDAVQETLQRAGGRTVLNPAPARRLPDDVLALVDVLVPNRGELGALLEAPEPAAVAEVSELAGRLRGPRVTVVTLGAEGALLIEGGRAIHVPGMEVEVVDTTAAGDCFCAALADALVRGGSAEDAVGWAVAAGALATTRPGAQGAMPSAREVHALLG